MDDAGAVGQLQATRHLAGNGRRLGRRQVAALADERLERGAIHQLEHDVRTVVGPGVLVEQAHDARMVQPGDHVGLAAEPRQQVGIVLHAGVHELHRHGLAGVLVDRAPHRGHAPAADGALQPVATSQQVAGRRHGRGWVARTPAT